jgi:hypothetical protein
MRLSARTGAFSIATASMCLDHLLEIKGFAVAFQKDCSRSSRKRMILLM